MQKLQKVAEQQNLFRNTVNGQKVLQFVYNFSKKGLSSNKAFTIDNCKVSKAKKIEMLYSAGIIEKEKMSTAQPQR